VAAFDVAAHASLQKGICYFDNYILHQSCNCWHGFMGRY